MSSVDEMYHTCRWCKHFSDEKCTKGIVDVLVMDDVVGDILGDESVEVYIRNSDEFYCKEWE